MLAISLKALKITDYIYMRCHCSSIHGFTETLSQPVPIWHKTVLIACYLLSLGSVYGETRYSVTDIGFSLGSAGYIQANAINNKGTVVGYYTRSGSPTRRAFLYNGGTLTDIGVISEAETGGQSVTNTPSGIVKLPPPESAAEANAINDADQIVGISTTQSGEFNAFLYSNGQMTDIDALSGTHGGIAKAINCAGQIAGCSGLIGVIWKDRAMSDIGSLGGSLTHVNAINSSGQVTGYSWVEDFTPFHAFLYSEKRMIDLGTLGGKASAGNGINDMGQVVGYADISENVKRHAALFSGGVVIDLGTLGGPQSEALGINNEGLIVGTSYSTAVGGVRAFIYSGGQMQDLNTLVDLESSGIERLHEAVAINDLGQIICSGTGRRGTSAFLLTPLDNSNKQSRLSAFSLRATAGSGDQTLIVGFVIAGAPQSVLLRGVGPALSNFGVASPLSDPKIAVFRDNSIMASNDDWGNAYMMPSIVAAEMFGGAYPLTDNSKDAALVTEFQPGNYTFHVSATNSERGIALAEIYETEAGPSFLHGLSGRANVGVGDEVTIAGFAIVGTAPRRILVRVLGPSLSSQGVQGVLADPAMTVFSGSTPIARNDDWGTSGNAIAAALAATKVGLPTLPTGSKDAALFLLLQPGVYTVVVTGIGDATGVGLIEIYDIE
jgi:probable HAF family extracellular repeat protein